MKEARKEEEAVVEDERSRRGKVREREGNQQPVLHLLIHWLLFHCPLDSINSVSRVSAAEPHPSSTAAAAVVVARAILYLPPCLVCG